MRPRISSGPNSSRSRGWKKAAYELAFLFSSVADASLYRTKGWHDIQSPTKKHEVCENSKWSFPLCEQCVGGMRFDGSGECVLTEETKQLRIKLSQLAKERNQVGCFLYPYLSSETFSRRQRFAAHYLDESRAQRILDIGAYNNPITSFITHCPSKVTIVEPCGELSHGGLTAWFSGNVSCRVTKEQTLVNVVPASIKTVIQSNPLFHHDAVVYIGCDPNYGPNWKELMMLPRPFKLLLESSFITSGKYPASETDGCTVVQEQDFDFNQCPDCQFSHPSQRTYAKGRKLIIFDCGSRIVSIRSRDEANRLVQQLCDDIPSPKTRRSTSSYKALACTSEKHIYDAAFLAINASDLQEEQGMRKLRDSFESNTKCKHCKARFKAKKSCMQCKAERHECRKRWSITEQQVDDYKDRMKVLQQATEHQVAGIWELISDVSTIRCELSAAVPQAHVSELLKESILLYDKLFINALKFEQGNIQAPISDRFLIEKCPSHLNLQYMDMISGMEPILEIGRNLAYREMGTLISFFPYRHLFTFDSVREKARHQRRVLLDVGANGFTASPKQLFDMYGAYLPFHDVIMIDPHQEDMERIPSFYLSKANFTFLKGYVAVGSRSLDPSKLDVITWMREHILRDDFFVLKFDVDEGTSGPTMEWGFLDDLIKAQQLELVDELYIEMHYQWRPMWAHDLHSGQQRYDIIHQLRSCGLAVHDWP
uniref:Uncharacterized protein n=1 Tax=Picocystis salinarum TaxID=88271 RepID=A0A7S3U8I6_9CHLO|mmetsp:Transcript_5738/g.35689  ORF Transcript_5738/g.35689 Transcript_5738/m.35689 type:complete len:710 (-) Transcript_5738:53-2182(-)